MMDRTTERRVASGFTLIELIIAIAIIAILVALTIVAFGVFDARSKVQQTESTLEILEAAVEAYETESGRAVSWGDTVANWPDKDVRGEVAHFLGVNELLRSIGRAPSVRDAIASLPPAALKRLDSTESPDPEFIRVLNPSSPNFVDEEPNGAAAVALGLSQYDAGDWDDTVSVLDAWGTPIRMIHPGPTLAELERLGVNLASITFDADQTVRMSVANMPIVSGAFGGSANPLADFWAVEEFYGVAPGRTLVFVSAGPDRRFGSRSASASDELRAFAEDNVYSELVEQN